MKTQAIKSNAVYFLEKPFKDKDVIYLNNMHDRPREVRDAFSVFLQSNPIFKLEPYQIIGMVKEKGIIINYNYSFYKTHTAIEVNNQIYICEQREHTIAYFIKVLYFLEIIK